MAKITLLRTHPTWREYAVAVTAMSTRVLNKAVFDPAAADYKNKAP
jgi:hypothetical protein